jgi:hypothetical protein
MVQATRGVTIRDFLIFQLKLVIDGFKSVVVFQLSIGAMILDLISGRGRRPRLFYSLLRINERFDLWLNLNGPATRLDSGNGDGLFGASKAGSDTMLGKLEQMVRGGDTPHRQKVRVYQSSMRTTGDPRMRRSA